MNWLIGLFGPIGERTKRILATAGGILIFIRPIFKGELPQLDPSMPVLTLPWPGIPAVLPYLDWAVIALGVLAGIAFVDKFTPARNSAVFGAGTDPIRVTERPVVEVVTVQPEK